jgi:AcrR family transcriptional regulator
MSSSESNLPKRGRKPKQQRSLVTRESILEAALRIYAQKGFHGTNSKEIAAEAGVSIGTFYNYFTDKKELFLEVMRRHITEVMEIIDLRQRELEKHGKFHSEGMREMIEAVLAAHYLSPEFHREATAMELTDPDVAAMNAEYQKKNMKRVVGWFHRYRDKLRVEDVEAAAVIVGLAMEEVIHTITISRPPVQPERLISELADMLSKYLFKDTPRKLGANNSGSEREPNE